MESIAKITGRFKVIQSTSDKLIAYYLEDGAIKGEHATLTKDSKSKIINVDLILRIDYNQYHILNSNIGIIVKRL